jgi:hypothetical protein
MADAKTTQLAQLAATPATNDMLMVVDVSDTTMAASGTNKRLPASYVARSDAGKKLITGDGTELTLTGSGTAMLQDRALLPLGGSLTISGGVITVTGNYHTIDTEGGAATDDLDTINGGTTGQLLLLRTVAGARDVTLKTGTGNLLLGADVTLGGTGDVVLLFCVGSSWLRVAFGDN